MIEQLFFRLLTAGSPHCFPLGSSSFQSSPRVNPLWWSTEKLVRHHLVPRSPRGPAEFLTDTEVTGTTQPRSTSNELKSFLGSGTQASVPHPSGDERALAAVAEPETTLGSASVQAWEGRR